MNNTHIHVCKQNEIPENMSFKLGIKNDHKCERINMASR